jgi:hypothetical protein
MLRRRLAGLVFLPGRRLIKTQGRHHIDRAILAGANGGVYVPLLELGI